MDRPFAALVVRPASSVLSAEIRLLWPALGPRNGPRASGSAMGGESSRLRFQPGKHFASERQARAAWLDDGCGAIVDPSEVVPAKSNEPEFREGDHLEVIDRVATLKRRPGAFLRVASVDGGRRYRRDALGVRAAATSDVIGARSVGLGDLPTSGVPVRHHRRQALRRIQRRFQRLPASKVRNWLKRFRARRLPDADRRSDGNGRSLPRGRDAKPPLGSSSSAPAFLR